MARFIEGGITAPKGFRAAGIACGIKKSGALDLALLTASAPCTWGGMFTTSRVKAHPVIDARKKLRAGKPVSGILVNSGSANACTGPEGMKDLRKILARLSAATGIPAANLLMSSTGVIGERLPTAKILPGLDTLAASLSPGGGGPASRAIMTTDTVPKECAVAVETSLGTITIGGMAKGAGMINPHMATMLAFLTTDAALATEVLADLLREAVEQTFNRLDLDSDTSTNDSVFLLAGAASGIAPDGKGIVTLGEGLHAVCSELARMIAADTEGATKLVTVIVNGAVNDRQAERAARTVAESPLVKTALHGQDPNWGRILAALGRSGARFNPSKVAVTVNETPLVVRGVKNPEVTEEVARLSLVPREVSLVIDLAAGRGRCTILTGDLTADYIRINASYRS